MIKKETQKTTKKITPKVIRPIYEIDAEQKVLGRLSCQIANLLRGKNKATYQPHLDQGGIVIITNAAKIKITGKKIAQKTYYHHSGYPGGLKRKTLSTVMAANPAEVIRRTVWNMLPKNKLRKIMFKRLKITN